jgi:hypothetical protein
MKLPLSSLLAFAALLILPTTQHAEPYRAESASIVGEASHEESTENIELVGHLDHRSLAVAVQDDYAYVAAGSLGLSIISISDPAQPTEIGSYVTPSPSMDVTVAGNYAYVLGKECSLMVFDVADPAHPKFTSRVFLPGPPAPGFTFCVPGHIAVNGEYVYLTWSYSRFTPTTETYGFLGVIDVTNKAQPSPPAFVLLPWSASGLAVTGSYAYVGVYAYGLYVIDVTDPAHPHQDGAYKPPNGGAGIAVAKNYLYNVGKVVFQDGTTSYYLSTIDISSPTSPVQVGSFDVQTLSYDVAALGEYAYVGNGESGLRVVNVSDPAQPSEAALYDTPGNTNDVAVKGNCVYLADEDGGLFILGFQDGPTCKRQQTFLPLVLAEGR